MYNARIWQNGSYMYLIYIKTALLSRARDLGFTPYSVVSANSENSGKAVHLHRPVLAFAGQSI